MSLVELVSIELDRYEISNKNIPDIKKIIGIDKLPLSNTYVSIEIKGIPTAYINAFRRTSIDEMTGYALQIPTDMDWGETTDEFMLPQFVSQRISLIPLKNNLTSDYNKILFNLIVENNTIDVMNVYSKDLQLISGKLSEPIFNPTFKICILQPGRKIVIKNIYIGSGIGKDNIAFQRVRCASYTHLDIPQYDKKETHDINGSMVDYSGYKISSLESNPMHHKYSCIIPSTNNDKNEIKMLFIEVCNNIKERLRYILSHIELAINKESNNQDIEYNIFQLTEGIYEGVLNIIGETYTIGELIKKTIYDLIPDIINVKYIILQHENKLQITIQYKEHVTGILVKSIKYCLTTFDKLQNQFKSYKL
jgi:DNA-directed RNA polymerase subunit L